MLFTKLLTGLTKERIIWGLGVLLVLSIGWFQVIKPNRDIIYHHQCTIDSLSGVIGYLNGELTYREQAFRDSLESWKIQDSITDVLVYEEIRKYYEEAANTLNGPPPDSTEFAVWLRSRFPNLYNSTGSPSN